jgi:UDP-N-acetylmuramyl pentapeptide synthase
VEHRLRIVTSAGGVTVIDDAFNTNPVSSKSALDVLKMFAPRRIIVTPGMVELGVDEATADEEACLMEHYLSEDTMDRWCAYLERQGVAID